MTAVASRPAGTAQGTVRVAEHVADRPRRIDAPGVSASPAEWRARPLAQSRPAGAAGALAAASTVSAAMTTLADLTRDAAGWSGPDRRDLLGRLDHLVDGLSAVRAAVLLAERESGAWRASGAGDRSFEAWRARTSRSGERAAAAQVRQADGLAAVPAAAAAVTDGRIGLEHAAVIGRLAATGTPAQQQAVRSEAGQAQLIALAEELDAGTYAPTVARWAATIDPAALEADHEAQRRERFLTLADTPRGTFLKGRLDTMAGHRVRLALEALTPRPAADDDRDAGQRCADALDTMAGRILSDPGTKPGGHVPPHVSLILTEQTWAAARAERDRRRATQGPRPVRAGRPGPAERPGPAGRPDDRRLGAPASLGTDADGATPPGRASTAARPDCQPRDDSRPLEPTEPEAPQPEAPQPEAPQPVGYEPATLEDGTPVPATELAQVLCDCAVTRIAIGADGTPLDLGRTQRLFTGEQRRAVIARDRECIWPGCHMPARWSQIHHIVWWERDNGTTCVDDGCLLCAFHHHEVHRLDLTITRISQLPNEQRRSAGPPGAGPPGSERFCSAPPGRRRRATIALVDYELRDPAGRLIGESSTATSVDAHAGAGGGDRAGAGAGAGGGGRGEMGGVSR